MCRKNRRNAIDHKPGVVRHESRSNKIRAWIKIDPSLHEGDARITVRSIFCTADITLQTRTTARRDFREHDTATGSVVATFSLGLSVKGTSELSIETRRVIGQHCEIDGIYLVRVNGVWIRGMDERMSSD